MIENWGDGNMSKATLLGVATAVSVVMFGLTDMASAAKAKRLTYDQAWTECKKEVSLLGGDAATTAARYTRGAACMKRYGYRLKRSSVSAI